MSKTFEEQIKILQESLNISYKEAKERMIIYNATDEDEDGKLIIISNFLKVIEYMKYKENYDTLLSITAVKQNDHFELEYKLKSKTNEFINLYILIKDKNQSINYLYENATKFEEEIDKKFDIIFY